MKRKSRLVALASVAVAALLLAPAARAQVAPFRYWIPGGPFGFGGDAETQYWGSAPDEDGFRKGFSFRSFSMPVNSFASGLALGGLASSGAQYAYSFKGIGDTPMHLFGGVSSLRSTPDVFTSLVTPGFERSNTLATSINAGIAFSPTANTSLSFSANVVQPSATAETDLRSQMLSAQQPGFFGRR